jgi:Uma2 family endonuclease
MVTNLISVLITLDEFLKQPETTPASEYIDGIIYQKPMPQGKHSRLQLKFCNAINEVAEKSKIAITKWRCAIAFPELRCTFSNRSIVPDASVFLWQRISFDENGEIDNSFFIAPDWVIEILSPHQNSTKVISNILHCIKHDCKLGWLIDPESRIILVFQPQQLPLELSGEDILPILSFIDLKLTVNQVFSWLKPS